MRVLKDEMEPAQQALNKKLPGLSELHTQAEALQMKGADVAAKEAKPKEEHKMMPAEVQSNENVSAELARERAALDRQRLEQAHARNAIERDRKLLAKELKDLAKARKQLSAERKTHAKVVREFLRSANLKLDEIERLCTTLLHARFALECEYGAQTRDISARIRAAREAEASNAQATADLRQLLSAIPQMVEQLKQEVTTTLAEQGAEN